MATIFFFAVAIAIAAAVRAVSFARYDEKIQHR